MRADLHTARGTQVNEVTDIQYYEGMDHKVAFVWGVTSKGHELVFKPQDLFPEEEVERVIEAMEVKHEQR